MPGALPVTNIVELIDEQLKASNPKAALAIAEWMALIAILNHMDHILCHLDPAVLAQAVQDTAACGGGEAALKPH